MHIRLKFRYYIKQVKSLGITLHIKSKLMDHNVCLFLKTEVRMSQFEFLNQISNLLNHRLSKNLKLWLVSSLASQHKSRSLGHTCTYDVCWKIELICPCTDLKNTYPSSLIFRKNNIFSLKNRLGVRANVDKLDSRMKLFT